MTDDHAAQDLMPTRIERLFAAPVSRVFAAWTTPEVLKRWAWGSLGRDVEAEVDLRVGGGYEITTKSPDGQAWRFSGKYLEIDPDRRLAYTLRWDAPMGYEVGEERVTVEFSDRDRDTLVTFLHEGVSGTVATQTHEKGWNNTFDMLEEVLRASPEVPPRR